MTAARGAPHAYFQLEEWRLCGWGLYGVTVMQYGSPMHTASSAGNRPVYRRMTPLLLLGLAVLLGCRREEPTYVKVSAATPPSAQPAKAEVALPSGATPGSDLPPGHPPSGGGMPGVGMQGAGMAGAVPPPSPVPEGAGLGWKLPAGWTEARTGGMRYATLRPAEGAAEVSVVVLGGSAGGELANLNRWRGQLGLPPVDEAGMAAARKAVKSGAGEISVYDLVGQGQPASHMVVGLLSLNGGTWFLKMTGESAAVEAARGAFTQILESLEAR